MNLLEKLKAGTRNTKTIKFPGTSQDVLIKVLSNADLQDAAFATEMLFKSKGIEMSMSIVDAYEDEKTTQILYRALRDPIDQTKPITASIDEFKSLITKAEKDKLVDEYITLEQECSPNIDSMSEADMHAFLDELKKSPETLGNVSNIITARRLISFLVSQLQNSQKDNGSMS